MLKFGIIGCGNMGGAMLRQLLKAEIYAPEEIIAADKNAALRQKIKDELGVAVTTDNADAAKAPVLLLAVKPQFIREVGQEIAPAIRADGLILSIVAGYELRMLHELLRAPEAHIVRVMPNTPAMVGEGVLAASRGKFVTDQEWQTAMRLLSCMGLAEEVPENLMDAVTGLSGSSPAFAFLMIEALAETSALLRDAVPGHGAAVRRPGAGRQRQAGAGNGAASGRAQGYGHVARRHNYRGRSRPGKGRLPRRRDGRGGSGRRKVEILPFLTEEFDGRKDVCYNKPFILIYIS